MVTLRPKNYKKIRKKKECPFGQKIHKFETN